jgi:UDP-N-acetylglucosamine 1-carboxyvinyltransferase
VDKLLVQGGRRLRGAVRAHGSKNASLGVLAATLLVEGVSTIHNVPQTSDVLTLLEIMRSLGVSCEMSDDGTAVIDARRITSTMPTYHLVRRMRASFHVAGPLLTRAGSVDIGFPGGCAIGSRPVDFHMRGFESMGAEVKQRHGRMIARCRRLHGTRIYQDPRYCSVGATLNIMMAATLAEGTTVIENSSRDPDVVETATFLSDAGAQIDGIGTPTIEIRGVDRLVGDCVHSVCGDRIEAGTILVAGAVTNGDVTVTGIRPDHLERFLEKLTEANVDVQLGPEQIRVSCDRRPTAVDIVTAPHPGFPTDLQPIFAVLAAIAEGTSVFEEAIFDGRLQYVDELRRMNARIRRVGNAGNVAIIDGVDQLSGAPVRASDLRAGGSLLLASLCAEGESEITGVENIDRGYHQIEAKFLALGADIRRVPVIDGAAAIEAGL